MTIHNIAAAPPVSLEEFAALPKHPRYELVRGVLVELMAASREHERTVVRTSRYMDIHVDDHDLGEVYGSNRGYITVPESPATSRMPDVSFISTERLQPDVFGKLYNGAPDLAVEILSESNTRGGNSAEGVRIPERRRQGRLGHRHRRPHPDRVYGRGAAAGNTHRRRQP